MQVTHINKSNSHAHEHNAKIACHLSHQGYCYCAHVSCTAFLVHEHEFVRQRVINRLGHNAVEEPIRITRTTFTRMFCTDSLVYGAILLH